MQSHESLNIIALIPAYNEAKRLSEVIVGARKFLPVLVVDDGSTDETAARAAESGAIVLHQTPNQGKGAALKAGFQKALSEEYNALVTLDADGQHDPEDIPEFLQAYEQTRADLIVGARSFSQIPPLRRATNTIGRFLFSWAMRQPILDNQSGYRLLSRPMMEAMLTSEEQGFQFEVEMILTCVQRGYRLEWVPIRTIYSGGGSHIRPLQHVLEFTRMVFQTRRRTKKPPLP